MARRSNRNTAIHAIRLALIEGEASGTAEPFDIEAFLTEQRLAAERSAESRASQRMANP